MIVYDITDQSSWYSVSSWIDEVVMVSKCVCMSCVCMSCVCMSCVLHVIFYYIKTHC